VCSSTISTHHDHDVLYVFKYAVIDTSKVHAHLRICIKRTSDKRLAPRAARRSNHLIPNFAALKEKVNRWLVATTFQLQ